MKTYPYMIVIALMALLACTSADEVSAPDDSLLAVRLVAAQHDLPVSRATDGYYTAATGFDGTEAVRIYMGNETAIYNVGTADANDNYRSALTPVTSRIYYPSGAQGSVNVWSVYPSASAPATALSGATGTHVVAYDQTTEAGYKASDLMYATKEVSLSQKATPQLLTFNHHLVKLKLIITKSAGVSDIAKVELKNVKRQATVTANAVGMTLSNLVTPSSDANGDNILISGPITDTDTHTCVIVFPAQEWAAADFIQVTSSSNETATYQLTKNTWTIGAEYAMTITVTPDAISFVPFVVDWQSEDIQKQM